MRGHLLSNTIAMAAMVSIINCASASAEVIKVITHPTVIVPGIQRTTLVPVYSEMVPTSSSTTVIRTERAVVAPVVTTTPTVMSHSETTYSESTTKSPDPVGRLRNMMDQITLGESKGLLTADEDASLRAEYSRLDNVIQGDLAGGLTTAENDDIERQLTIFNQMISKAMQ